MSGSIATQIVEGFGIQSGTKLAAEVSQQLVAAEALALQETKLAPNDRADNTTLYLVSRSRIANATFTSPGSVITARGTCNQDGAFVAFSKREPPIVPGPYEFIVEGRSVRVYRLKELVWQSDE